jgi:putative inorganic carbon (hco3(-)) transporter
VSPARSPLPRAEPDHEAPPPRPAPAGMPPPPRPARSREVPPPRGEGAASWLYSGHLLGVFSIALSNILLGLAVLAAPRAARRAPLSRERLALLAPLAIPLGLYVLLLLAAIAASADPRASARGAAELFSLATLALAPLLVRGERAVRRLLDGLVLLAALLAAWGLAQYLLGYGDLDRRIRGPFSHYMTFSGLLLLADLLLAAAVLCGRPGRWRWRWPALALVNVALLGSLTRGAWVALLPALTVLVVVCRRRLLLAYVPAALLFVLLAPVPVLQRAGSIFDLGDSSNYDRLCMAEAGLRMVAERPLTGIGPNLVKERYPLYRSPTAPRYRIPHLHNSYLQLAAERGLPALGAFLALLAGSAWLAVRRYRREGRGAGPRADLYLGVLAALLAFCLAGLFENNWGDTEVQRVVLFLLAVPYCLNDRLSDRPNDRPADRLPGTSVAPRLGRTPAPPAPDALDRP